MDQRLVELNIVREKVQEIINNKNLKNNLFKTINFKGISTKYSFFLTKNVLFFLTKNATDISTKLRGINNFQNYF